METTNSEIFRDYLEGYRTWTLLLIPRMPFCGYSSECWTCINEDDPCLYFGGRFKRARPNIKNALFKSCLVRGPIRIQTSPPDQSSEPSKQREPQGGTPCFCLPIVRWGPSIERRSHVRMRVIITPVPLVTSQNPSCSRFRRNYPKYCRYNPYSCRVACAGKPHESPGRKADMLWFEISPSCWQNKHPARTATLRKVCSDFAWALLRNTYKQ